jgi:hypothetical protein
MAEGRERRRTLERLIARLRATEPDEPGRLALEHALLVLEGQAVPRPKATHKSPSAGSHAHGGSGSSGHGHASAVPEVTAGAAATSADLAVAAPTTAASVQSMDRNLAEVLTAQDGTASHADDSSAADQAQTRDAGADPTAAPEAGVGPARRLVPSGVTVIELMARAEGAIDAGLPERALEAMLDLAALHASNGRIEAALDACYAALSLDPDSVALHLALAELYTEKGWDALANEKLQLLERLARLDGDEGVAAEIAGIRAGRD